LSNQFFRSKRFFAIIAIALGISGVVITASNAGWGTNRSHYRPFDFDQDLWVVDFRQRYQIAQEQNENWVEDPIAIALRVAGYPNFDNTNPNEIHISYRNSTQMTAVIRSIKLMDDSVSAKEIRVDLIYQSGRWEIEWAGGRWKCQRELISFPGWQTSLCS
jgi:hypothetical protein